MDVALAGRDRPDGVHDLGVGGLLEHVAARAGVERLAQVARVVLHREHEHLCLRSVLPQRRDDLDPALAGHHDVQQHDVRLLLQRLEDGSLGVRRLADGLDVRLGVEHAAQAAAHDGVVVDDEHTDHHERDLRDERRPGPPRRLDPQPPADEAEPLAHADEAEALLADGRGSKPRPSSSTTAATRPSLLRRAGC